MEFIPASIDDDIHDDMNGSNITGGEKGTATFT